MSALSTQQITRILKTFALFIFTSLSLMNCSKDEEKKQQALELICATNVTEVACQSQANINSKFANWLATATFKSGCNAAITNNNSGAPNACGGTTTVQFTVTSSCDSILTCAAVFAIVTAPAVVLLCAVNGNEPRGQTQAEIDAKFTIWLASVVTAGGCNSILTNNNTGAPPYTGGTTTVTFVATSTCEPGKSCISTFSVY